MTKPIVLTTLLLVVWHGVLGAGKEQMERSFPAPDLCRLEPGGCRGLSGLVDRARASLTPVEDPERTIALLNRFFFEQEGFRPAGPAPGKGLPLPAGVIASREGDCVGLATLYLVLSSELGLPVHAVSTPGHVFVRWDDGRFRRNIELLEGGREIPDAAYIHDERISEAGIRTGTFLRNLDGKEFLGLVHQNLGVQASQRSDFGGARKHYRAALRLNPRLSVAWYNLGNDYLALGRYRSAARSFTKALELDPGDASALRNRAVASRSFTP